VAPSKQLAGVGLRLSNSQQAMAVGDRYPRNLSLPLAEAHYNRMMTKVPHF